MWISHWGLSRDPFAASESAYVSLPSHDEAVARLLFMIEASQRRAIFAAPSGLGKTAVARKVLAEAAGPRTRTALVSCPRDGNVLFTLLAERLGQRVGREPSRLAAWRALERAVRLASLQATRLVLVIDDCDDQLDATARRDLDSLVHLGSTTNTGFTMIQVEQTAVGAHSVVLGAWTLTIGLQPLTRSQAERFLTTKIERAGGSAQILTTRSITRLHALSLGNPRGLEQITSLSLMAGAVRGLEVVHADLVDAVAPECFANLNAAPG